MPEYVIPSRRRDLPSFVQGFVEAAFFTNTSCFDSEEWATSDAQHRIAEGQADGELPNDVGMDDIAEDDIAGIVRFCEKFQADNAALLAAAYERDYDEEQAGRDLWFTCNGHGVGYCDRDALEADGLGDKLSDAARYYEINPWFDGETGKVHFGL